MLYGTLVKKYNGEEVLTSTLLPLVLIVITRLSDCSDAKNNEETAANTINPMINHNLDLN